MSSAQEKISSLYEGRFKLKDSREVLIRPIRPADEQLLVDLFGKLKLDSIYMRFLTRMNALPEDLLFQLTHIDYHKNFALVALTREGSRDSAVAVARYGYDPANNATDLAVTVRDDWQQNGLGEFLLSEIISIGLEHGISRFVSMLDPANSVIKHILQKTGHTVRYSRKEGCATVEIFVRK